MQNIFALMLKYFTFVIEKIYTAMHIWKDLTNSDAILIISLIKAEMKNYKLIKGLDQAGALTEDFYLDLDRIVLNLLSIEDDDEREAFYKIYDEHLDRLLELNIDDFTVKLNDLALELYIDLVTEKKLNEKLKNLPDHPEED